MMTSISTSNFPGSLKKYICLSNLNDSLINLGALKSKFMDWHWYFKQSDYIGLSGVFIQECWTLNNLSIWHFLGFTNTQQLNNFENWSLPCTSLVSAWFSTDSASRPKLQNVCVHRNERVPNSKCDKQAIESSLLGAGALFLIQNDPPLPSVGLVMLDIA